MGRFADWIRGRREERSRDFTTPIVTAWQELAEGRGTGADPAALAVVAACARTWADALSALVVTGPDAIDRVFLADAGEDLVRRGSSRWKITVTGGRIALERPAYAQRTAGGWILTWNRDPGDSTTETALPGEVLNLLWERSPRDTWTGIPPWRGLTATLLAELELHNSDLFGGPAGHLIALTERNYGQQMRSGQAANNAAREAEAAGIALGGPFDEKARPSPPAVIGPRLGGRRRGSLATIISGAYMATGESGSIRPGKVEHAISEGTSSARERMERTIAGACGVPYAMLSGEGSAAIREAQRSFSNTLQMRADRLAADMTRQLGAAVSLDASGVFRADVMMRSRALKSLVDAGVPLAEARQAVGI